MIKFKFYFINLDRFKIIIVEKKPVKVTIIENGSILVIKVILFFVLILIV